MNKSGGFLGKATQQFPQIAPTNPEKSVPISKPLALSAEPTFIVTFPQAHEASIRWAGESSGINHPLVLSNSGLEPCPPSSPSTLSLGELP